MTALIGGMALIGGGPYIPPSERFRPRGAMKRADATGEARGSGRVRTRLRVQYGVDAAERTGEAQNVSEAGLYINTNSTYKVGTRIVVRLEFPGRTFEHRGTVIWAIRAPESMCESMVCGMGIQFSVTESGWPAFFRAWTGEAKAPADPRPAGRCP
jgi:hypothetical protein